MASIMEGPLSKWTNVMKGWQYRWFVLDYNAGLLSYYTSKDKMMRGSRRGCVRLRGAVIGIDDEDDSTFTITVDQKTFHFQARDADEREKWIHALEETILRHTLQLQISTTLAFFQSSGISPVLEFSKIIGLDSGFVPSVQDFDKKLTEADAYLQILIEQLKLFDDKLQNCKDDEQRKKIETLKETTNSMVESIKHCIVLLQIAKSTINPVDAIYQPSPLEPVISTMPSQTVLPSEPAQLCKSEQRPSSLPVGPVLATLGHHQTPTPNSTGSGHSPPSSSLTSPSHVNLSPNTVPEFSYSSSEDEFYDADEYHQSGSSPKRLIDSSGSASVLTHSSSGNSLKLPDTTESLNSSMSNGTSDADLLDSRDDRDDEGEAGSVEEHKSVIMHILSQVRLGMDLTKVVLPTFILERRSLLEMYADFFAHPDLFVSISDQKDPRDRMVQVVKWYLSAFHAGRRGSVAKKPYNPILGEIFQCHWTLPNDTEENTELVSEGPVPWVSKNSVTFVAEQVSHHPPISAFYAECFNKKIQFNAHIWTKSKFLGMSIGVHNIGQGCVSCLDYDEHYILTFPNGYGRSILTVPWVELGGECNINCSKTGYNATIIFHTKPFYGGKKHRITAEIFSPNDKKSFCSIEGEWNGIMYAKYATGENTVFIDTKKLPIIKKKVRKLEDQNEYESRCLWKDVTFNLKIRDIDAATEAKHRLEERQRAEARERKEKEIQWETRLFHEDGECWVYDEPLLKRLGAAKH
ncbi:PREDICTED: oxysterol-binding protein-related protein 9-like isoform X1 [Elephantulus edwardii]|uniref:oxysterol-binding protein-related protein 9-like isoform X1 n=1 Tax=Elephantulus edwardii TaxID=28737 RepID=UPI0003F0F21C|nr:PREDICTED: oxysterol-binding protein-related protein 9-like isoform X1 [Elephantulus edwardii]